MNIPRNTARSSTEKRDDGNFWLLQLDVTAKVTTDLGVRKARLKGESIFIARGESDSRRGFNAARFAIAIGSVTGRQGPTGVITVLGCSSTGSLTIKGRSAQFDCDIDCQINDEHIDAVRIPDRLKSCYYQPAFEPCAAHFSGRIETGRVNWTIRKGDLRIVCAAGGVGQVRLVEMPLNGLKLVSLQTLPGFTVIGPSPDSNSPYDPCVASTRRTLTVQPVGFRTGPGDASPSASTAAAQLATAQTVWNKGCIDINIQPTVFIDDATLKTSSDLAAIRAAFTDSDPNVIEVFFVQNPLTSTGGGNAGAIGVASCKPVIAEPNGGNPVLVSHELGHVLNLLHPGVGSNSDPGTVMQPTGSAMNPGTNLVTHNMCISIANPVLATTVTACCFSHDKGDHFIRDFPTDAGSEPSDPLPAGMTRYSMSNVWNRLTATPGTFSAATGPEHESPYRFNPDMTPKTNFLFATVEQRQALKVRSAAVKFFLKTPGSGGGGGNLTYLGQVNVPDALALGVPQTVQLQWTVPAGAPSHSCVFGVVTSPSEPDGDQSGLNWAQFEDLAHQDNDWAQRNLDIENVSSSNTDDSSNMVESAPWVIRLPKKTRTMDLGLEIDARSAAGLLMIEAEVLNVGRWKITPGKTFNIRSKISNQTGIVVVVLHVRLPSRCPLNQRFTVLVNPRLGKTALIGFGTTFLITSRRTVVDQLLDRTLAAFTDLGLAIDSGAACSLERRARKLFRDEPCSFDSFIEGAAGLLDQARWNDIFGELPRAFRLNEAFKRAAGGWPSSDAKPEDIAAAIELFRALVQRLQMAADEVGVFPRYPVVAPPKEWPPLPFQPCSCSK